MIFRRNGVDLEHFLNNLSCMYSGLKYGFGACLRSTQRQQRSIHTNIILITFLNSGDFKTDISVQISTYRDISMIMYFLIYSIGEKVNTQEMVIFSNKLIRFKKIVRILVRIFLHCLKVKFPFVIHRCLVEHVIPRFKIF